MQVTKARFDALVAACGSDADAEAKVREVFEVAAPRAGQVYVTPAGKRRLLVVTEDGREAVVNPDNGRLLTHGAEGVFTSWSRRIEADGYTLQDECDCY